MRCFCRILQFLVPVLLLGPSSHFLFPAPTGARAESSRGIPATDRDPHPGPERISPVTLACERLRNLPEEKARLILVSDMGPNVYGMDTAPSGSGGNDLYVNNAGAPEKQSVLRDGRPGGISG